MPHLAKQKQKGAEILKLFQLQNKSYARVRFKHNPFKKSKAPARGPLSDYLAAPSAASPESPAGVASEDESTVVSASVWAPHFSHTPAASCVFPQAGHLFIAFLLHLNDAGFT